MIPLLLVFFFALFVGDYLLFERGYPIYGRLLAEAFAGWFLLVVVAQFVSHRRFDLPPKYIIWMLIMIFVIVAGAVANNVSTGAVVMGVRENFKYAPLFLLPLVYSFKPEQMRTILLCVLGFACMQFPLMIYQRINEKLLTGDTITGTLLSSNHVSIFLICSWAVFFGFYLRKKISLITFVLFSFLILFPTMLNETKGSLVLLPIAFLVPLIYTANIKHLVPKLMFGLGVFAIVAVGYSVVGAILLEDRFGQPMFQFFFDPDALESYLMPSAQGGSWMGRLDKLFFAWENVSKSTVTMMLGVGFGNVNDTSHAIFAGEYTEFGTLLGTGFNAFLWETGVIGVVLSLIVPVMSFSDARRVAAADSYVSIVANGWVAVALITLLSTFYIRASEAQAISYLYWFFAGYIAAESHRLRMGKTLVATTSVVSDDSEFRVLTPEMLAHRS